MKRVPTPDELNYWNGRLKQSGENYTDLITSHRQWLAANPTPVCNPSEVFNKLYGQNGGERCFGGIGGGCSDQVNGALKLAFPWAKINANCTVTAAVSVGSILHDNCCRQNHLGVTGLHCAGLQFEQDAKTGFSTGPISRFAVWSGARRSSTCWKDAPGR